MIKVLFVIAVCFFSYDSLAQNILIKLDISLSGHFQSVLNEKPLRKNLVETGFSQIVEFCKKDGYQNIQLFLEDYHTHLPQINTQFDIIIKDTIIHKDTSFVDYFRVYEYHLPKHLIPNYEGNVGFSMVEKDLNTFLLKRIQISILSKKNYFLPLDKTSKNISKKEAQKKSFFKNVVIRIKGNEKDSNIIRIKHILDKRCAYHQHYYTQKHQNKRYFNYYLLYESEKTPVLNDLIEFELNIQKKENGYQVDIVTDPKKVDTFLHKDIHFKDYSSFFLPEELIKKSSLLVYKKIGVITGLLLNNVEVVPFGAR